MINSRELRLGNWVNSKIKGCTRIKEGHVQLTEEQLYYLFDVDDDWERIDSIPITEEWLDKCDYDKSYWRVDRMVDGDEEESEEIWEVRRAYCDKNHQVEWIYYCDILFIHEWQNLYFAVTGNELF